VIAAEVAEAAAISYTSMLVVELAVVVVLDAMRAVVLPSSANEACSRLRLPAETLTTLLVAPPKCCSLRDVTLLDADSRDKADTKLLVMLVAALQAHTLRFHQHAKPLHGQKREGNTTNTSNEQNWMPQLAEDLGGRLTLRPRSRQRLQGPEQWLLQ
jgi:hypothetical protein